MTDIQADPNPSKHLDIPIPEELRKAIIKAVLPPELRCRLDLEHRLPGNLVDFILQAAAPTLYATWVGGELERIEAAVTALCEQARDSARRQTDEHYKAMEHAAEDALVEVLALLRQRAATLRGGDGG